MYGQTPRLVKAYDGMATTVAAARARPRAVEAAFADEVAG